MPKNDYDIIIFFVVVSALIACLVTFIAFMFVTYRRRQNTFQHHLEEIQLNHEQTLLKTQLEMQEQTFQHISREIHDNINLSLTLAKLNLNTIDLVDKSNSSLKIESSIQLLTKSIRELSSISKGLNTDLIIQNGLVKAIDEELGRIRETERFSINYLLSGNPVYLDSQIELIVFRIVQEAFNNILKHANPSLVNLTLHYGNSCLRVSISDNGIGFDLNSAWVAGKAGLHNMDIRAKMLGGAMEIITNSESGTTLNFTIPFQTNEK